MKKIIIVLLFLFSVFSIVGCKKTELEIKGPNEVEVGCSILLSTNLENNSNVVWETSDPNIATVFNGTVIGVQEGNVVISAKLNDLEATYSIKVLSTTLTISITGPNVVYINEMVLFEANLSKEINSEISWSVSDEQIAFIDNDGYLTGLLEGKIDVIVTVLGVEERFSVTVMEEPEYYDPNIYSISVQYTEKIELGQNYNLKPSIKPHIPNITYVFESSDSNIIQINENGNYKGLNVGLTEIKVYILGNEQIYSTIIIEVIKTSPDSIKITGDNTMIQGKYNNLSVNITGGENKEIIWESSDNTTAIVSFGIVLAFKPGTVTIKAISKVNDEVFDTFEINISFKLASSTSYLVISLPLETSLKISSNEALSSIFIMVSLVLSIISITPFIFFIAFLYTFSIASGVRQSFIAISESFTFLGFNLKQSGQNAKYSETTNLSL